MVLSLPMGLQGLGAWAGRKYLYVSLKQRSPFFVITTGVLVSALSLLFFNHGISMEGIGFFIRGIGLDMATIACLTAPMLWADKQYNSDTSVIIRLLQQVSGAIGGVFSGVLIYLMTCHVLSLQNVYLLFFAISTATGILMILMILMILSIKFTNLEKLSH